MLFEDFESDYWAGAEYKADEAFELYEQGQLPKALDKLQSALETNPTNGSWHFNKALTLDAMDRFDEAIAEYKLAAELNSEDLEVLNSLAVDYTRIGFYDLAINVFEQIEQLDCGFEPCYCNRIITYTEMDKHDLAEEMFYLAQQINPDCPLCYYNIGNSLFARGNYKKSVWCWKRTAILEPSHPQIDYRIAQAYWADGNYECGREHFLAELRCNPADVEVILDFGLFLLEAEDVESAKEKFNRILELDDGAKQGRQTQNNAFGEPHNQVPSTTRSYLAAAHHYLGEIAFNNGDYAKAIELFQQALQNDSNLTGPRYRLGQCALISGQTRQAEDFLLAELELGPENSDILLSIGSILLQLNRLDTAAHCFLSVINKDEENADALFYLGVTLAISGKYNDAIELFEHALKVKPDSLAVLKAELLAQLAAGRLDDAARKSASIDLPGLNDPQLTRLQRRIRRKLIWAAILGTLARNLMTND